jgi:hypothetical protein
VAGFLAGKIKGIGAIANIRAGKNRLSGVSDMPERSIYIFGQHRSNHRQQTLFLTYHLREL